MQLLVVLSAVVACALAKPGLISPYGLVGAPIAYSSPLVSHQLAYSAVPAVTQTQYHAQNELGQASFGHSSPGQVHNAVRDAAGNVAGSFSYVDPTGRVLTTNYIADGLGYRVASNALPVGPSALPVAPLPVQDTPEVVAARAAHLTAVAAARSRVKRGVVAAAPVALSAQVVANHVATAPIAYSSIASPLAYSSIASPLAYSSIASPLAYSSIAAPLAHSVVASPVAYSTAVAAPAVPALHPATLTTVVNNPGHAISYRVD